MLIVSQTQLQKFAYFSKNESPVINDVKSLDGKRVFLYSIPIEIDQSKIENFSGDLIVSAYTSKKRSQAISIKRSDIASGNILKKISNQKMMQDKEIQSSRRYIFRKYVDRPDLSLSLIRLEAEIPDSYIDDTFNVEISTVGNDKRVTFLDSLQVNHRALLSNYDLPTSNFSLTVTRSSRGEIYASAISSDPKIGYFVFSLRKDSSGDFVRRKFGSSKEAEVSSSGIASVTFSVDDADYSYTVRAYPVSKILKQKIGNYLEESLSFIGNVKQLPFYVAELKNDLVSFTAQGINSEVEKILMFRRSFVNNEREFVGNAVQSQGSISIRDIGRIPQYDYIYDFDYIDSAGTMQKSPTEILVPALKLDNLAKIFVSTANSSTGSQETEKTGKMSFNVSVEYDTSTAYDQIVSDLRSVGLESLISDDLKKMTNNLKPLTRVLVSRISKVTGIESDLGVFPPGKISVEAAQEEACIYRFEVAVRSAPEVLESLTSGQNVISDNSFNLKSLPDLSSKSIGNRSKVTNSSFSSKFFTKSSIRDSTLRYGDASSLSDLSYYAGRTGVFADYAYSPPKNKSNGIITSISTKKNGDGVFLTWSYKGILSEIDFFSILIDGQQRKCIASNASMQTFFLGKISSKKVKISAVGKNQSELAIAYAEIR